MLERPRSWPSLASARSAWAAAMPTPRSTSVKHLDLLTKTLMSFEGAGNCWPVHQFTTSSGSITEMEPSGLVQTGISAWPFLLCSWAEVRLLAKLSRRPADAGALTATRPAPSSAQASTWASEFDLFI